MNPEIPTLGSQWRQVRFNPLRYLTPERLAAALDAWQTGYLRDAALIFETIEARDAIVRSVMTKRRSSVARRPWQIIVPDPDDPRAEAHKETLDYFYRNLTVTDATDANVRTGFAGLVRQMMDAVIQRYAVHEIVFQEQAGGLTAEMRRVPIYFFENRTGRLRFIGAGAGYTSNGLPLEEDGWMITTADGLGEALAVCHMFKRLGLQDWLAYSEKFSIPGVLGRTSAPKDSPEGQAMAEAVAAYASEWVGVIYGDNGSIQNPVEVITTGGSGTSLPQQELANYMDRMISALVRGADLSTLSQKDSPGASLQKGEIRTLLEDDCALVSETLQTQLDRLVIRAAHGDEQPAAYVVIKPRPNRDMASDLAIDKQLAGQGVTQDPAALAARYGRTLAGRKNFTR
jgi:phage gp29-like protein